MRRLIAAINITLDRYCDHTVAIADEETHQHYIIMSRLKNESALLSRCNTQAIQATA